ncbi:MAG: hypothetical protein ABSF64_11555 [Bryobacteraceae bacterium]
MTLCVAPEGAEFLAVFAALLGKAGGYVLDAFEAFFDGHRFLHRN